MLRVSSHLHKTTLLALHQNYAKTQVALLKCKPKSTQGTVNLARPCTMPREPCPPKPPTPPPPPPDDTLFWALMGVMVVAGSFAYYARNQPEIRDWLTLRANWFDEFMAIIFQEDDSYLKSLSDFQIYLNEKFKEFLCSKKRDPICDAPADIAHPCERHVVSKEEIERMEKEKREKHEETTCLKLLGELEDDYTYCEEKEAPIKCRTDEDICELDRCLKEQALEIKNNWLTAMEVSAIYNKEVKDGMRHFEYKKLRELEELNEDRKMLFAKHTQMAQDIHKKWDELRKYAYCGCEVNPVIWGQVKQALDHNENVANYYKQMALLQDHEAHLREKQFCLVNKAMKNYENYLQPMWKTLDFENESLKIEGNEDYLLIINQTIIDRLRGEFDDLTKSYNSRLRHGMDGMKMSKKDQDAKMAQYRTLELKNITKDESDKIAAIRKRYKAATEAAKKKATEEFEAKLQAAVEQAEKEAIREKDRKIAEVMKFEKGKMDMELNKMRNKLERVEQTLEYRTKAFREAKSAKNLYLAALSLLDATSKGGSGPICVVDELEKLEKESETSGPADKLVKTVVKSIPPEVYKDGIMPESVLKERYYEMEKLAMNVAMLETEGGPLPLYLFSWLQSKLLFTGLKTNIPVKELENPPEEPFEDMDTFDLMLRARYYLNRGDIATALRYVDNLQGASRSVAQNWYQKAQHFVQTRQAAEAIVAQASAMSLKTM